ncbi:polyprotein [Laodelphax striatellus picorna-like virus 2]|uniref:polyprotein n=1 Tax=Laodelphax striatellus picorna-like virus 2 TaxID=1566869 RepID=UPI000535F64B|nr:polyprotein [Laodelphax striatellus picorna-like virus 2]AIX94679.1 polyprotein [Laodelphax striatellus picorna-like virus 2]
MSLVRLVEVTKSRNRGFYAAEKKIWVYTPTPKTYDRPIGPKNMFDPTHFWSWEERVAHRLKKNFAGREEDFLYKFYHLIHFMDKKINRARAVERPHTRGMSFTLAVVAAWKDMLPSYLRLLRKRERKGRTPKARPSFSFARMCEILEVEELPDWTPPAEDLLASPPSPSTRSKRREIPLPKWDKSNKIFHPPAPRVRNAHLLAVLRGLLWFMRAKRCNNFTPSVVPGRHIIKNKRTSYFRNGVPYAFPEGNESVEKVDQNLSPTIHESNRVCIVETHDCSEVTIPGMDISPSMGAGEIPREYSALMEDEILFDNFTWSGESKDSLLKEYVMPAKIITMIGKNPVLAPFGLHQYWRGDISIRAVVNANKFQSGQLQLSWWYDTLSDSKFNLRKQISSASQTPHAIVNAGASNECCLNIGYRSPFTCLPLTGTDKYSDCLNLGSLMIRVLTPLKSSDSVAKTCSVSLFIKFKNSKFFGSKSADVGRYVEPQMMEGAMALASLSVAEKALNQILPDINRDNPPVTKAVSHMIPHAMQSLCSGTGSTEPINHLRLDARGQTPHLENSNTLTRWSDIAKTYGFIHSYKWSKDHVYGTKLFSLHAAPLQPLNTYQSHKIDSDTAYPIPPVAVASSLFSYWRGTLKMRIDMVATSMHTGKLAVVYIPRTLDEVDWSSARGSPHVIIDLKDGVQSYTISIPFITNRYAWPRRINTGDSDSLVDPPGKVYVFVINKLIPMEAVSNDVFLNIYWAGGNDFELLVPCQPSFGTCFFASSDKPNEEVKAYGGYWPFYWGYYGDFFGGVKAIARYGKGWQHVAQFQNLKPNCYYTVNADSLIYMPPYMLKNDGTKFDPKYFGPINLNDGVGWRYLGVFETEENARKYAALPVDKKDYSLFMDVQNNDDGPWSNLTNNPIFDETVVKSDSFVQAVTFARHENDPNSSEATNDAPVVLECVPPPQSNIAPVTFGEDFDDIKTLMRRYQPYCMFEGVTSPDVGTASVALPLVPQGLDLDISPFEAKGKYFNKYVRDGTIPIVASAYRYMRGSMRLRIVLPSDVKCNIWVQHRPDSHADKWLPKMLGEHDVTSCYLNTGYSVGFQTTKVNNTYSIEIPYYQPFSFILSQRTDLKRPVAQSVSSLGTLFIGFEQNSGTVKRFPVSVFYSLGDDAFFEYFQGFPPMIPISSSTPVSEALQNAAHEGIFDSVVEKASGAAMKSDTMRGVVTRLTDTVEGAVNKVITDEGIQVQHKIKLDDVNFHINLSRETQDFINNSGSRSAEFVEQVLGTSNPDEATGIAQQFISWLTTVSGGVINFGVDLVSQIMHCIINPVKEAVAIATITILVKLGVVNGAFFDRMLTGSKNLLAYLGICNTPTEPNETGEVPRADPQGSFDMITSFIDVAFVAVSTVLQTSINPPRNITDFSKILTKEISQNVRTANQITLFMKNNILLFKKVAEYCTAWINKDKFMEKLIQDEMVPLLSWIDECEILLDPKNEERSYAKDSEWASRIECAYITGCSINKHFEAYVKVQRGHRELYDMFKRLLGKITKRREDMFKRGNGTVSRREPFCIWIYGSAGVGKSQLAQHIIPRLLEHAGISYLGEPIYTLPSGAKYWTGCRAQPAILLDDYLNVQTGEIRDEAIRHIFAIKSPAALNPPMAHLDDKELRYTPEILVICSNHAFPDFNGVHMEAVWRRREVLLTCTLTPELEDAGFKNFSDNVAQAKEYCRDNNIDYQNFEHMRIVHALNPSEPTTNHSNPHSIHTLMVKLRNDFMEYRRHQQALYDRRKEEYDARIRETSGDVLSLTEKQAEYKRMCTALNDYTWHEHVPFKDVLRLSQIYSNTGTISEEMKACLQDTHKNVMKDFESTRSADPENDPDKPIVASEGLPAPPPKQGAISKNPPTDCPNTVIDASKLTPTTSIDASNNHIKCTVGINDNVAKVSLENILYFTHTGSRADVCHMKEIQSICQKYFSLNIPFDCFAATILFELIQTNKLKPVTVIAGSYSCGIPSMHVQIKDKIAILMCLQCNKPVQGASVHPTCKSLRWLNVNLPPATNFLTPKTLFFYGNKEQLAVLENVSNLPLIDALRVLYLRYDIWPCIDKKISEPLEQLLMSYFRVHNAKALKEILEKKYQNETEINRIILAGKVLETIIERYPKCIHGKLKYDYPLMLQTVDNKRAFTSSNLDDEIKIPDDSCGGDCVFLKNPELGEALYAQWNLHNPTSDCKPQYFEELRNRRAETGNNGTTANSNTSFFSKLRRLFTSIWTTVKKLGDWMWRHISPVLQPLWKFMKYFLVFFLLIGALWGVYALATGSSIAATYATATTAIGSAVGGTCAAVGATWTRVVGRAPEVVVAPMPEGVTNYNETLSAASRNPAPRAVSFARHQSNPNSQKINEILRIIERNTYFITADASTTWNRMVGIYQNHFIVQKHYYDYWINSGCKTLNIWRSDNSIRITVNIEDVHLSSLPEKSLAILHIPAMPYVRKITHLFASLKDHTVPRGKCFMLEVMPTNTVAIHELAVNYCEQLMINSTAAIPKQDLTAVYEYAWHGNGRCGSYLIAPHLNHPIIGIHCAGAGNKGYADPVASEMFEEFNGEMFEVGHNHDDTPHPSFKGSYLPIGRTDQGMAHHESGVSRLTPSKIAGVFPVVSAPAPLRKGDPRVPVEEGEVYSPLWAGVSNMGILTRDFPKAHRDTSMDYQIQRLISIAKPNRDSCGPLSYNDAVCGIPALPHYESINFSTSEGFPWSRFRPNGCHNKEWLFELETDENGHKVLYSINNLLWDQINNEIQDRLEGIPVSTIFDDCLKDTRMALDKISKPGKTRIFSISPVQYTIVFKQYFGDFLSAYTSARLDLGHAIGIAADSSEWGMLVRALTTKGTHFVTGDYKNFGPGLNTACLRAVCKSILAWYEVYDNSPSKLDNMKIRKALLDELVCARHCAHDFIYSVLAGLPSGCPATAPLNSLVNELYMLCAWLGIMCGTEYASLNYFYTLTKLITYGDDFIMSVNPKISHIFNGQTIQGYFKTYDIILTSADKTSDEMQPFVTDLSKCTFLKRGFKPHPTRPFEFLAPLDLDFSVKDVANWVHKSPDMNLATIVNAEACVRNAYGHGEAVYNEVRARIIEACCKKDIPILLKTWHEYDAQFFPPS